MVPGPWSLVPGPSSWSTWASSWPQLARPELHLGELHLGELHLGELHLGELLVNLGELLVNLAQLAWSSFPGVGTAGQELLVELLARFDRAPTAGQARAPGPPGQAPRPAVQLAIAHGSSAADHGQVCATAGPAAQLGGLTAKKKPAMRPVKWDSWPGLVGQVELHQGQGSGEL